MVSKTRVNAATLPKYNGRPVILIGQVGQVNLHHGLSKLDYNVNILIIIIKLFHFYQKASDM